MREASGLVRSKKLFGGLLNDIKRKKPFYISDFLHGLHPQCLSSFLFLYFACLAPIVAFGALLGEATENRIATIESLVSGTYTYLHCLLTTVMLLAGGQFGSSVNPIPTKGADYAHHINSKT